MYNSDLKYYIKALLGPKNDMWHFDKLERSFSKTNIALTSRVLNWANKQVEENNYRPTANFVENPIYDLAMKLREECLTDNHHVFLDKPIQVLIHLPPISQSTGGYSWFYNLGTALRHMGITTGFFWDNIHGINLDKTKKILVFTSFNDFYLANLRKSGFIEEAKSHNVSIGYTIPLTIGTAKELEAYRNPLFLTDYESFFYCFNSSEYVKKTWVEGTMASAYRQSILSLEFAANPLYHYPARFINPVADYIFLGSSNHDKIKRYHDYFIKFFRSSYTGIIAGPGWSWCKNYEFNLHADKYLYSRARIALNLHIDQQLQSKTELNERTYQLAAMGIPQLTDSPALLPDRFSKIGLIAQNQHEYFSVFEKFLYNKSYLFDLSISTLKEVYQKHSTFNRLNDFFLKLPTSFSL